MLRSFGATPETIHYANDFLDIILAGTVFQVVGFSLNNIIRAEGNAKIAMYSMLISAGTNMILNPIFIFGFGMGVKGSAYATVISMIILTIWVLIHFNSSKSVIKLRFENILFDWKILLEIIAIGMAPFFMQIANSIVQGLINTKLIAFGGDLAVGAMGIVNSVLTLIVMSVVAINMATQPIISFNYGAKAYSRVKETLRVAIISATVISIFAFILVEWLPESIVKLFNSSDAGLLEYANATLTQVATGTMAETLYGATAQYTENTWLDWNNNPVVERTYYDASGNKLGSSNTNTNTWTDPMTNATVTSTNTGYNDANWGWLGSEWSDTNGGSGSNYRAVNQDGSYTETGTWSDGINTNSYSYNYDAMGNFTGGTNRGRARRDLAAGDRRRASPPGRDHRYRSQRDREDPRRDARDRSAAEPRLHQSLVRQGGAGARG
jgi:hypothetical protein